MKIRGIKVKKLLTNLIGGLLTLWFLSLVRPDSNVTITDIAIAAVLLYEGFRWSVRYIVRIQCESIKYRKLRKKLKVRNQIDDEMERVAEIEFRRIA